jgi:DNA/RNA endonuclease G (NUC1)
MPNALAASYRYTNVCPQLAAFNTGVWAELETAVRAWSLRHKRLWVVTGPVPDTVSSRGIGPGKVPVPASFFKCVVDIHPPRLAAVAFVLPNAASTQPFNAYRLSVSELERQLGYPLLRPLPDSLEQALSERMNLQHWTHGQ